MNEDEKAEMLSDLTMLICNKLKTTIDEVHALFKTYPELQNILSLIVDLSLLDTDLIQVIAGRSGLIKSRIQNIQEKTK